MCMLILPVHCQVHVQSEHGPCVHQEYIQHVEAAAAAAALGRSSDTNSSLQLSLPLSCKSEMKHTQNGQIFMLESEECETYILRRWLCLKSEMKVYYLCFWNWVTGQEIW